MLLGAARILSECRNTFKGRIRLLFQPAEEGGVPSGAQAMIEEGALDGVDAIFGMHIQATLPSGVFSYGFGPRMTGSGRWKVLIRGKGSHGAFPEWSKDPIVAASNFVTNLQTLVSREVRPLDAAVVSVGIFKPSSEVFNIIPDRVELGGTTRAFRQEVQTLLADGIQRIAEFSAATHRCTVEVDFHHALPPLINDAAVAGLARDAALALWEESSLLEEEPQMGSEDFSYYLEKIPGAYCFFGCGGEGTSSPYAHHSPKFRIDESVLWKGSAQHAATAWRYLQA
jgi:amidohydrolase